ncbi:MAG: aspartate aminotransferase family protein [Spirochaetales bacterium]|nr:aspartate aminotransferase family protein [Spirochaetales bacterium]
MSGSEVFRFDGSLALYERARRVMPGGVNASVRINRALGHPLFIERGEGAYLYDVDGHRFIDYCISHGASLLGHGNPAVVSAVEEALRMGMLLSCETEIQVRVAEQLLRLFPGAQMVRYACSGTETTWHALRIARAYTGKWGVIKFEGHYHGVNDTAGYSHWPSLKEAGPADSPRPVADSAGIPPANNELITILPFNDVDALERCLRSKAGELAALIMEPVNYDSCGLRPTDEFLRAVRDLTMELGVVLIFDEVLSGFRIRAGAALGDEIRPDMTVLGKAVGGGMPISVFMGKREIMETCTPVGPALHSGTYNAPPVLVSAIGAFLNEISRPGFYDHLNALGDRLYTGMKEIFRRRGIKAWVQGVGSRFGLLFGLDEEPRNYRDVSRQDMAMMSTFIRGCINRGVYLHHVSPHHGYSIAHTIADIEETLDVMDRAAAVVCLKPSIVA